MMMWTSIESNIMKFQMWWLVEILSMTTLKPNIPFLFHADYDIQVWYYRIDDISFITILSLKNLTHVIHRVVVSSCIISITNLFLFYLITKQELLRRSISSNNSVLPKLQPHKRKQTGFPTWCFWIKKTYAALKVDLFRS